MFYGEYIHGIDQKGRLILPSRFRDVAKENNIEKFLHPANPFDLTPADVGIEAASLRKAMVRIRNAIKEKEQRKSIVFHEIAHDAALEYELDDSKAWLKISGWKKELWNLAQKLIARL